MVDQHIPTIQRSDDEAPRVKGNFGEVIEADVLYLPKVVYQILEENNWRGGGILDFISAADTFPSAFAEALGWSPEEVKKAVRSLVMHLTVVFPALTWPDLDAPRPQYAFGAMPPPGKAFGDYKA